MILTSDELIQMLREILLRQPAPTAEAPDVAAIRARMTAEVESIRSAGGVVDIPAEVPSPDDDDTQT